MFADVLPYVPVVGIVLTGLIVGYTRRDNRVRAVERHEAAGPDVKVLSGNLSGQTVKVRLQLVGGPSITDVTIRSGGSECTGISGQRDHKLGPNRRVEQPSTHPLERIEVYGHLSVEPRRSHGQVLPLVVDVVEAADEPTRRMRLGRQPRRWTRRVSVPITFPPTLY